jgi:hypothetical protein
MTARCERLQSVSTVKPAQKCQFSGQIKKIPELINLIYLMKVRNMTKISEMYPTGWMGSSFPDPKANLLLICTSFHYKKILLRRRLQIFIGRPQAIGMENVGFSSLICTTSKIGQSYSDSRQQPCCHSSTWNTVNYFIAFSMMMYS